METTMLDAALSQGIWAVVAVFLLIYVVKSNEQRDKKQEERENNYQSVIEKLTEKYQILYICFLLYPTIEQNQNIGTL